MKVDPYGTVGCLLFIASAMFTAWMSFYVVRLIANAFFDGLFL